MMGISEQLALGSIVAVTPDLRIVSQRREVHKDRSDRVRACPPVTGGQYDRSTYDRGATTMDQQLPLANIVTLGVRDFAREREFYRRLGWPHAFDSNEFTVFELRGALLALFGIDQLGTDARAAPEPGHGGIRSSVIITVDRSEDVDALVRRAREAGATVTKEPTDAEFFEGRDAYFADPEGNYWEVAWSASENPVTVAARRAAGIATDVQPE